MLFKDYSVRVLTAGDAFALVDFGEECAAVVDRQVGEVDSGQHWRRRGHATGRRRRRRTRARPCAVSGYKALSNTQRTETVARNFYSPMLSKNIVKPPRLALFSFRYAVCLIKR